MAKFRTEIEVARAPFNLSHDEPIVMLGSCFTDNVGALLDRDGFDVTHNPMGPLYNPASLFNAIALGRCVISRKHPKCRDARPVRPTPNGLIANADDGRTGRASLHSVTFDTPSELTLKQDDNGAWHCLDFASRYSDADRQRLIDKTRADLQALGDALRRASTLILTLGTSFVFAMESRIVGNCHKFPPQTFTRRRLSTEENANWLRRILSILPQNVQRVIFTVSPIRHVGDGLHANQLSKAALLLAIDAVMAETDKATYFPAYELVLDDLRDYRFYATDMKHPSDLAIDYIYDKFAQAYFSPATATAALAARKQTLRSAHRPIL